MATAAAVFSTSTSSFRASQSQAPMSQQDASLSMLPTVDFPFDDLRRRMAEFTVRFDAFIEKSRKRVLEEKNNYRAKMSDLDDQKRSTKTQITSLETTLSTHGSVVAREVAETREMHTAISKLEDHQHQQLQVREKLKQQIAATQRQIDQKVLAQKEYAKKQDSQARLNTPELGFWETYLGCRIEGSGEEDRVRISYVFPPRLGQQDREAAFELKVPESTGTYEVVNLRPALEGSQVQVAEVLEKLNDTREIAVLLKGMRKLFAEHMK